MRMYEGVGRAFLKVSATLALVCRCRPTSVHDLAADVAHALDHQVSADAAAIVGALLRRVDEGAVSDETLARIYVPAARAVIVCRAGQIRADSAFANASSEQDQHQQCQYSHAVLYAELGFNLCLNSLENKLVRDVYYES
jgi:hypothetical protein